MYHVIGEGVVLGTTTVVVVFGVMVKVLGLNNPLNPFDLENYGLRNNKTGNRETITIVERNLGYSSRSPHP